MLREELNKRTPLRIFEKSIHGGLGKGNIGVLASRKGVGKTACLVHIAMDKLFRDQAVIHVSYSARIDHIITWYEDIFNEIAKKRNLSSAEEIRQEITKNRVIMNFNQKGISTPAVLKSVATMIKDGNFAAECVIIDGYNIQECDPADLDAIKAFAREMNLEVWMSVSLKGEEPIFDEAGYPGEIMGFMDKLDVVITLQYRGSDVQLTVVKDHGGSQPKDMNLMLDTKTLLIVEK